MEKYALLSMQKSRPSIKFNRLPAAAWPVQPNKLYDVPWRFIPKQLDFPDEYNENRGTGNDGNIEDDNGKGCDIKTESY